MDPSWLPTVPLTASGRPVLLLAEVERSLLPSVDLLPEPNPNPNPNFIPAIKSVLLILTSHRLLLVDEASAAARALPLSSVVHAFPPKKSLKHLFSSAPKIRLQISPAGAGGSAARSEVLTVAVRGPKSDPEAFFERLWEALKARAWEGSEAAAEEGSTASASSGSGGGIRMPVVGVAGLMRKEQEMWENTDKSLHDAFQDLNALMSKAKEMVSLAEKMRLKLLSTTGAQQENANDGEMGSKQEMQDWLLSVGIASPVTKESAGALYHQQLARQLADFVKLPLEKSGGMIALVDVYCLFNRARGTELISPEDLLQACALWEKLDVPVMLRKFDSGVKVIQSKVHSDEEVFARITSFTQKPDALRTGISPSDAALMLGIAPTLAKEHLLSAESKGLLCRDVSPDGFRFYANLFKEFDPKNMYLVKDHGLFQVWISATSFSADN